MDELIAILNVKSGILVLSLLYEFSYGFRINNYCFTVPCYKALNNLKTCHYTG